MTYYEIFGILRTVIITLRAALYDSSVAVRCFNDESNNYQAKFLPFQRPLMHLSINQQQPKPISLHHLRFFDRSEFPLPNYFRYAIKPIQVTPRHFQYYLNAPTHLAIAPILQLKMQLRMPHQQHSNAIQMLKLPVTPILQPTMKKLQPRQLSLVHIFKAIQLQLPY